ncbi:MAG: hypothetical protein U1E63_17165 [Burkholderiales bacterium]
MIEVPIGQIDMGERDPAPRPEATTTLVNKANRTTIRSLLLAQPICVIPSADDRWKIIAGSAAYLIARSTFQANETIPVIALPDARKGEARVLPLVEELFAHLLSPGPPSPERWNEIPDDTFNGLGRDLESPTVRDVFVAKTANAAKAKRAYRRRLGLPTDLPPAPGPASVADDAPGTAEQRADSQPTKS